MSTLPHPAIRCARQPEKNLVVAEREPVIRRQLRAQLSRRRGVRPHQRGERLLPDVCSINT